MSPFIRRPWLPPIVIAALTALVYSTSLDGAFVFDDIVWIVKNPAIHTLDTSKPELQKWALTDWTFALNYAIGGTDVVGYHLTNIAIHIAAALTFYAFLLRVLATDRFSPEVQQNSPTLAFAAAILWAVHPLNTQAVTYVIQRMESLASLFYFVVLYAVVRSNRYPWLWLSVAVVAAYLGLWSKEILITAPILATVCHAVFVRPARHAWLIRVAIASLITLSFVARQPDLFTAAAKHIAAADTVTPAPANLDSDAAAPNGNLDPPLESGAQVFTVPTAWEYLRTQPEVLLYYVRLAVFPAGLRLDYGWDIQDRPLVWVPLGLFVIAAFLGSVWLLYRHPGIGFFAVWPWILLGPTSSFYPISEPIYEHRMYMPLAGMLVLAVIGAFQLGRTRLTQKQLCLLLIIPLMLFGTGTMIRNRDYRSRLAYWEDHAQKSPANGRVLYNYANELLLTGQTPKAVEHYARAREHTKIDGRLFLVCVNEARARHDLGQNQQAINVATQAIEISPTAMAFPYVLRATSHIDLGDAKAALVDLAKARDIQPGYEGLDYLEGKAFQTLGQMDDAAQSFLNAGKLQPDFAPAWIRAGFACKEAGQPRDAVMAFGKVIELIPNAYDAYAERAKLHLQLGQLDRAYNDAAVALQNEMGLSENWITMIRIELALNRTDNAHQLTKQFQSRGGVLPDDLQAKLKTKPNSNEAVPEAGKD